jgi:hypothetical protein
MAADHGIGEMEILDDGLQFSVMMTGDPAAEDEGQFVGLTNGAIGIEEPLFEGIDGSATTENEVIAELGLGKEQTMLNSSVLSLLGVKKGVKRASHFWAQETRTSAVRESASCCRACGSEQRKKALVHCWKSMPR